MAEGTIVVTRRSAYQDRLRAYKVFVDGAEVARVKNDQSAELPVEPGHHSVHLKVDWATSETVDVDVPDGGRVGLVCGPRANPLTAYWYITFGRSKYLRLERAEDA